MDTVQKQRPQQHLICLREGVDTTPFLEELAGREHLWMGYTQRQSALYYHSLTQTILLRHVSRSNSHEIPVCIDGPHESTRSEFSVFLRNSLQFAENFAEQNQLGLGRVALIQLAPHSIAYRHCDTELHLQNRKRYHLVIKAEPTNILCSGDETVPITSGQLFEYDNIASHKSYNDSDAWRIHLVFDAFPRHISQKPEPATNTRAAGSK